MSGAIEHGDKVEGLVDREAEALIAEREAALGRRLSIGELTEAYARAAITRRALRKYSEDEPREPAGSPGGGQWTSGGGGGGGFKDATPEAFIAARGGSSRAAFLSSHTADELRATGAKLHLSEDGKTGYALADGDLQNLFNNGGPKGAGRTAILDAIKNGAKTLDCFDGHLPALYSEYGFVATGRVPFNRDYAPPGWDYANYDTPDVVFMRYEGGDRATIGDRVGSFPKYESEVAPLYSDWDAAKSASRAP